MEVTTDHPDAVRLEAEMQAEYVEMYGEPDQDPDNSMYSASGVVMVRTDGEASGIGAWSRWPNGDGKVRLLYVNPKYRGRRLAEQLLTEMEALAKRAGARYMRFETGPQQPSAQRLYERCGYERLEKGFGFYQYSPGSVFYGKEL